MHVSWIHYSTEALQSGLIEQEMPVCISWRKVLHDLNDQRVFCGDLEELDSDLRWAGTIGGKICGTGEFKAIKR